MLTCCDTGMRSDGWAHDFECPDFPGLDKGTLRLDGTRTEPREARPNYSMSHPMYSRVRQATNRESHYTSKTTEDAIHLVRHLMNTKRLTGEIRLHVSQGACNSVTTIEKMQDV